MSGKQPRDDQSGNNGEGGAGQKKKGRGPDMPINAPDSENDRPLITIEGQRFRQEPYVEDAKIARLIGQIVRNLYPGGGITSYKDEWEADRKNACFYEFTRRYRVRSNTMKDAEELFNDIAHRNLQQSLHDARRRAIRKTKSSDPRDWENTEPHWILRPDWRLLIRDWCEEYFRTLSERNAENRSAQGGTAFATTGSRSILDYKYEMMEANGGQDPDMEDLYELTHTKKKTGQFVSDNAKKMKEKVNEARRKKYGDDPTNYPKWDMDLWCDATGGRPHGRYRGMGSAIDSRVRASRPIRMPTQQQPPHGYIDAETVEKMFAKHDEEAKIREAEIEKRYQEREAEQKKREAKRERRYLREMRRAMQESQMMLFQQMYGRRNDGASTSRQFNDDYNCNDSRPPNFHQPGVSMGDSHHRTNRCYEGDSDDSEDDSEDDVDSVPGSNNDL